MISSLSLIHIWCMTGHAACNLMPVVAANRIGTEEVVPCAENGNQSSALTFYGSSFITCLLYTSHILVKTIDEFKGMKPEDVVKYIEGEPSISVVPVAVSYTHLTLIAQGISAVFSLLIFFSRMRRYKSRFEWFDRHELRSMLRIAVPLSLIHI